MTIDSLHVATDSQLQQERLRRARLVQLGIEPLVSRRDWPGAAVAIRRVAPEAALELSGESTGGSAPAETKSGRTAADKPASGPELAALRASLSNLSPSNAPANAPPSAPSKIVNPEPATTAPNRGVESQPVSVTFQLLLASAGGWLWVEHLADGLIRREQLQLVQGMARAVAGAKVQLAHRQFDWPIRDHPHLPQHQEAAQHAVSGQLERFAVESAAAGLVIMGGDTAEYLQAPPGMPVVTIPSTLQMLTDAEHKKTAWSVLKHCRAGG